MINFTFSDLQELNENEKSLNKLLHLKKENEYSEMPRKDSIDNILAYSKALSIRKTDSGDFIENILN